MSKVPYHVRWGHQRKRTIKGHPKRQARRDRAAQRASKHRSSKEG